MKKIGYKLLVLACVAVIAAAGRGSAEAGPFQRPQQGTEPSLLPGGAEELHTKNDTLCTPEEDVYFSCSVGEKTLSLCARGNTDPDSGYVQYRYGSLVKPDMVFPESRVPPRGRLTYRIINEGSVQRDVVTFERGKYKYVVYSDYSSGVYVLADGEMVLQKTCEPGLRKHFVRKVRLGLPNEPAELSDSR